MLLLSTARGATQAVPGPRGAAREAGPQFLSQPRLLLSRLQRGEEGAPRPRASPLALSREETGLLRIAQPSPRLERPQSWKARPANGPEPDSHQIGCARREIEIRKWKLEIGK